jgi:hypothetical protein
MRSRGIVYAAHGHLPHARLILAVGFGVAVLVVGCGDDDEKIEAEGIIARHFDAVARRAYESAMGDYADQFFADVAREEWRNTLASIEEKLGRFQRYEILYQRPDSRTVAGPGTYLGITCRVSYSKHPAEEHFYVFRKNGAGKFRILAHRIDSAGFVDK